MARLALRSLREPCRKGARVPRNEARERAENMETPSLTVRPLMTRLEHKTLRDD